MLARTDWDKPFNASLQDLVSWLETKDPAETYEYKRGDCCLLSQFLIHHGMTDVSVGVIMWGGNHYYHEIPKYFNGIAVGTLFSDEHTFGAALARARSFLDGRQSTRHD
jgi:hypothetical protein